MLFQPLKNENMTDAFFLKLQFLRTMPALTEVTFTQSEYRFANVEVEYGF